jgi:hypothetical protein
MRATSTVQLLLLLMEVADSVRLTREDVIIVIKQPPTHFRLRYWLQARLLCRSMSAGHFLKFRKTVFIAAEGKHGCFQPTTGTTRWSILHLFYWVLQCSVLGSISFVTTAVDFIQFIEHHGSCPHRYAGDR